MNIFSFYSMVLYNRTRGGLPLNKVYTSIEVRYQETDQMGVVYHANYLVWFEIGRSKFVESLGFKYAEMEKVGYISPVTNVNVSYKRPVRYGETVKVATWVKSYNGVQTVYGYKIMNADGEIAALGESTHVVVSKDTFRPISLRKKFPDWHKAYLIQMQGE